MHQYAENTDERLSVHRLLAFVSVVLAIAITYLYNNFLDRYNNINWLVGPTSMLGVWAMCFVVYDKFIWKMQIGGSQRFSKIPNLNGTWKGEINSESRCEGRQVCAVLNINQTWSKILVKFESEFAHSHSRMAMLNIYGSVDEGLNYEFASEARGVKPCSKNEVDFAAAGKALRGTVTLRYFPSDKSLEGDYYTKADGEHRIGAVRYTFLSRQLLSLREAREQNETDTAVS